MVYNLTSLWDANNTFQMIDSVNTTSNGALIVFMLFVIYIAIIFIFQKQDMRKVIVADSFIVSVLGILLFAMGWLPLNYLVIPIILLFIGIFMAMFVN